jgi:predicted nucleic acid-binding protein
MRGSVFVDTNVLVYLFDSDEPAKQGRARSLLEAEAGGNRIVISTQVLQEFYVVTTRKLARPLPVEQAEDAVRRFTGLSIVQIDTDMILDAIRHSRERRASFWDSLIVQAALAGGCTRLLSEDIPHGLGLGPLRVENPFRS